MACTIFFLTTKAARSKRFIFSKISPSKMVICHQPLTLNTLNHPTGKQTRKSFNSARRTSFRLTVSSTMPLAFTRLSIPMRNVTVISSKAHSPTPLTFGYATSFTKNRPSIVLGHYGNTSMTEKFQESRATWT